ncbi:hypothetical protein [Candidatus Accumulibacter sp. ACC012]|uniref:hypothetical protein n=1 Tax=Candidatus Accumulibacter sp. ACC012 TaxID=2823332 RepID=UPI0025C7101D|nr:hypothetical protein [Candidatus Accumulibacter sp. ACC012]
MSLRLSPEANEVVQGMAQNARLSLQYSLYLMSKAYETTVFKQLSVDWSFVRRIRRNRDAAWRPRQSRGRLPDRKWQPP